MRGRGLQNKATQCVILWAALLLCRAGYAADTWIPHGLAGSATQAISLCTAWVQANGWPSSVCSTDSSNASAGFQCPNGSYHNKNWRTGTTGNYTYNAWSYCTDANCESYPPGKGMADADGQCVCANGATDFPACNNVDPDYCTAGTIHKFQSDSAPSGQFYCQDNCVYGLGPLSGDPDTPGGVVLGLDGQYLGNGVNTGEECTETNNGPPTTTEDCVQDSFGNAACVVPGKRNCGEFNGVEFCGENIPDSGVCILGNQGGYICNGATPPLYEDGSSPIDQGDIYGDSNADEVIEHGDVFTPSPGNEGGGGGGTTGGGGSCGGTGQPPCKIDESGTPTNVPESQFESKLAPVDDFISDVQTPGGVGDGDNSMGTFNPLGGLSSGGCQTITVGSPPMAWTFPTPPDGCAHMDELKEILGWVCYVLTAFYIIHLGFRRPV